jgi:hypothetical protein
VHNAPWLLLALVFAVSVEAPLRDPLAAQLPEQRLTVPPAVGRILPGLDSRKPQWFQASQHLADSTREHSDHRWEGGAIGALGLGTLALAVAAAGCNDPDSGATSCTGPVIGSFLVGAVVGGVTGLFIGSSIPKGESDSVAAEKYFNRLFEYPPP